MILRDITRKSLQNSHGSVSTSGDTFTVGGIAAMISGLVQSNSLLEAHLVHWLTTNNGEHAGLALGARRAAIATLAEKQGELPPSEYFDFTNFLDRQLGSDLEKEPGKLWKQTSDPA